MRDEAPGTRRPYRMFCNWPGWAWRLLPRSFRYHLVRVWDDYEHTPEYEQLEWDKFRAESRNDTVLDMLKVRFALPAHRAAWLEATGLTGDELVEEVCGRLPEKAPRGFGSLGVDWSSNLELDQP